MDNTVYINLDTLEFSSSIENSIHCDRDIAPILVELLSKGYKTVASCAGHNRSGFIQKTLESMEHYDDWIEEFQDHPLVRLVEKYDDERFVHMEEESATYVYVAFSDIIEFDEVPEGFNIMPFGERVSVGKYVEFFEDEGYKKRKKQVVIDKEIEQARQELLEWAKSLKPVNEKGMKL